MRRRKKERIDGRGKRRASWDKTKDKLLHFLVSFSSGNIYGITKLSFIFILRFMKVTFQSLLVIF